MRIEDFPYRLRDVFKTERPVRNSLGCIVGGKLGLIAGGIIFTKPHDLLQTNQDKIVESGVVLATLVIATNAVGLLKSAKSTTAGYCIGFMLAYGLAHAMQEGQHPRSDLNPIVREQLQP